MPAPRQLPASAFVGAGNFCGFWISHKAGGAIVVFGRD